MRIEQVASENRHECKRGQDCGSLSSSEQVTPQQMGDPHRVQLALPPPVPNIEEMKEKLIEMKSESHTVSEEESYKFQLSYVT